MLATKDKRTLPSSGKFYQAALLQSLFRISLPKPNENETNPRKEHPSPVKCSGRQWSTCIFTPTKREALYIDTVGPQRGFLPKKAAEFFFPTRKTGTGQWGTFLPQLPCLLYSDHSFRPNLLFTQSYFQENAFWNLLSTGMLGLCKSRDQGDLGTSFPPDRPFLTAPPNGQFQLFNKTEWQSCQQPRVKSIPKKGAWNRSSSPPICSSLAKDLLALAVN